MKFCIGNKLKTKTIKKTLSLSFDCLLKKFIYICYIITTNFFYSLFKIFIHFDINFSLFDTKNKTSVFSFIKFSYFIPK
jgi:hypothetical protein